MRVRPANFRRPEKALLTPLVSLRRMKAKLGVPAATTTAAHMRARVRYEMIKYR
jgi:hypothetical protein